MSKKHSKAARKAPAASVMTGDISGDYNIIVCNSDVTIINGGSISQSAATLLKIYSNLPPIEQAKLLVYAGELLENIKAS